MTFSYFVIVFTIFFLCLLSFRTGLIVKTFKHILPKVLTTILAISSAIVTLIYGIHTNVFSSYDRLEDNNHKQYNWLNPDDVLRFPVDQYGINKAGAYPTDSIDFSEVLVNKFPTKKITILLDKTGSLFEKTGSNKNSQEKELKTVLINHLDDRIGGFKQWNSSLEVQDLIFLTALDNITRFYQKDTIITTIQILYYQGENKSKKKINRNIEQFTYYNRETSDSHGEIMRQNLNKILSLNSRERKEINSRCTDFSSIANELKKDKFQEDAILKTEKDFRYDHKSLILISDFLHELDSKSSLRDVGRAWYEIGNIYSQVNLLSFEGDKTHESDPDAQEIVDILKRNLNHLYFFEFNSYIKSISNPFGEIISMFSTMTTDESKKSLIFYYSLENQDYKGSIHLIKASDSENLISSFSGRIRPANYTYPYSYLTFEKKNIKGEVEANNKLKLYENQKEALIGGSNQTYNISLVIDEIENKNLCLEFTQPTTNHTVRIPIIFKPVLPTTSSLLLFSLYIISILCLVFSGLYVIHISIEFGRLTNGFKIFFFLALTISFLILAYFLCKAIYVNLDHLNSYLNGMSFLRKLIFFALLLILSIYVISYRYHKEQYKALKRLYGKNIKLKNIKNEEKIKNSPQP
jgi:hypothetical protein